ncbi:MAG: hypothetical protein A3F54_02650 [Candidatus Kerfeldbacteria bacterium RIFCSPHIGHO2_12_FULL_48_17]|uniref:Uncharacterized protein n=1 Tax=Candidatus Kerfeldbacteria bacterium RIFCSPHIGHO2_12_FULL_48_17 TaxID=1798542 RepID=A0A1G2AYI4_9BACT|nr:MAG: hypothetical protein A3F54_02650 [Candidatus Kerfeldbacteria bacterium RIFCSPHIGHO2_12_FULL_48_17]
MSTIKKNLVEGTLYYQSVHPSDCGFSTDAFPYFCLETDQRYDTFDGARQALEEGKTLYRWEQVSPLNLLMRLLEGKGAYVFLEGRFEEASEETMTAYFMMEAGKLEAGEKVKTDDGHTRTKQDRMYGCKKIGYGKREDGSVWFEGTTYVDYSYRGPLR